MKYLPLALILVACAAPVTAAVTSNIPLTKMVEATPLFVGSGTLCTAVAISSTQALVAKHCVDSIEKDPSQYLKGVDGVHKITATVFGPVWDLAVLSIAEDLPFADWIEIRKEPIQKGEPLLAVGYGCDPLHKELSMHLGSAQSTTLDGYRYFSTQECHGDSGGPVLDTQGHLVALTARLAIDGSGSILTPLFYGGVPVWPFGAIDAYKE